MVVDFQFDSTCGRSGVPLFFCGLGGIVQVSLLVVMILIWVEVRVKQKKKEKNGKTSSNREWHIGIRRGVARSFFEGQREKQRQSSITYILYSLADSNKPR